MADDHQLLTEYVREKSRAALDELIRRHLSLVYSAAVRQVRDPHLAEDVTQAVFLVLAQKAGTIKRGVAVGGWLLTVTRHASLNAIKKRAIQRRHERMAATATISGADAAKWDEIMPHLDEEMSRLAGKDRDALVLRFFQDRSFAQIGAELALSEDAAQKRVSRAIDKLRKLLTRRGAVLSVGALGAVIGTRAVEAAPANLLGGTLAATAGGGTALASASIAKGAIAVMARAKAKLAAGLAIAAMLLCGTAVEIVRLAAAEKEPLHVVAVTAPARATAPTTKTGVVGDVRLLEQVIALYDANQRALLTWQGQATVTTTHSTATERPYQMITNVIFVQDLRGQQSRWNWDDQMASQDGNDISASKNLLHENAMRIVDTFYRYMPAKPQPDGTPSPGNLVLSPDSHPLERYSSDFDAKIFYSDGFSSTDYLRMLIASPPGLKGLTTIAQVDSRVVVETTSNVGVYRLEFDLSRSGNLVLARNTTPPVVDSWTFEFGKIRDVWVPNTVTIENTENDAAHKSYGRTWHFVQNRVNEDIPPDAFAWKSLGVKPGDNIHDNIQVKRYTYTKDGPAN